MESTESNFLGDYLHNMFDDVNDYSLFNSNINFGLENESELQFNGEIEPTKQFFETGSPEIDLWGFEEPCEDNEIDEPNQSSISNLTISSCNFPDTISSLNSISSIPIREDLWLSAEAKLSATEFQREHEPRIKYLLRFPKLWQEFMNSGNFEKLKILFADILSEGCIQLNSLSPPIVGREKMYNVQVSIQRNIPDFCVFYSNIVRSKKRLITMDGTSFGSFPYANSSCDKTISAWNFFETAPINIFDEHHKLQKQKYDTLKSQNKVIKFERRATWHIILSRDLRQIVKVMAFNVKNDIF